MKRQKRAELILPPKAYSAGEEVKKGRYRCVICGRLAVIDSKKGVLSSCEKCKKESFVQYWYQRPRGRCLCSSCQDRGIDKYYRYKDEGECSQCGVTRRETVEIVDPGERPGGGRRLDFVSYRVALSLDEERSRVGDWIAILSVGLLPIVTTLFFIKTSKPTTLSVLMGFAIGLIVLALILGVAQHVMYVLALNYNLFYRFHRIEKIRKVERRDRDRVFALQMNLLKKTRTMLRCQVVVFFSGLAFVVVVITWLATLPTRL